MFGREVEGGGGCAEWRDLGPELFQDRLTHPEKTQVVFECGKEDERPMASVRRHPVTDRLFCHRGSGPDGPAKLFECNPLFFRDRREVLVDILCRDGLRFLFRGNPLLMKNKRAEGIYTLSKRHYAISGLFYPPAAIFFIIHSSCPFTRLLFTVYPEYQAYPGFTKPHINPAKNIL
jgi:hypothetical protein